MGDELRGGESVTAWHACRSEEVRWLFGGHD